MQATLTEQQRQLLMRVLTEVSWSKFSHEDQQQLYKLTVMFGTLDLQKSG